MTDASEKRGCLYSYSSVCSFYLLCIRSKYGCVMTLLDASFWNKKGKLSICVLLCVYTVHYFRMEMWVDNISAFLQQQSTMLLCLSYLCLWSKSSHSCFWCELASLVSLQFKKHSKMLLCSVQCTKEAFSRIHHAVWVQYDTFIIWVVIHMYLLLLP